MEATDPPICRNSDQGFWALEDDRSSHARSYECTFCKRGFSNAQALGGHMNIHRKDRAKLKQPPTENQISLDSTGENPSYPPACIENESMDFESREDNDCSLQWPWIPAKEDDTTDDDQTQKEDLRKLSSLVKKPKTRKGLKSSSDVDGHEGREALPDHDSSSVELDLELRLGPDPREIPATATKQFF